MANPSPTCPSPALNSLRAAAWPEHAILDSAPAMVALMRPPITQAALLLSLRQLYPVWALLEGYLEAICISPVLMPFGSQRRTELLQKDLLRLGVSEPELTIMLERCGRFWIQPRASESTHLGMLYVLEGSKHGAKAIRKQLLISPEVSDFAGYGSFYGEPTFDPLLKWSRFTEILDQLLVSDTEITEACEGAVSTFRFFRNWMESCVEPPQVEEGFV